MFKTRIGCDLVHIKKFEETVQKTSQKLLEHIFSTHELASAPAMRTLAGFFAAKEAVIKALELKAGDWQKIEIVKDKMGRPGAKLAKPPRGILSHDISISHDGDYAVAVAVFLFK